MFVFVSSFFEFCAENKNGSQIISESLLSYKSSLFDGAGVLWCIHFEFCNISITSAKVYAMSLHLEIEFVHLRLKNLGKIFEIRKSFSHFKNI